MALKKIFSKVFLIYTCKDPNFAEKVNNFGGFFFDLHRVCQVRLFQVFAPLHISIPPTSFHLMFKALQTFHSAGFFYLSCLFLYLYHAVGQGRNIAFYVGSGNDFMFCRGRHSHTQLEHG